MTIEIATMTEKKEQREHELDSVEKWKPKCSICYETFLEKDLIIRLSCSHTYHKNCLTTWTAQNQTCPECRRSVDIFHECVKCHKPFVDEDLVVQLSCRHIFHNNCITSHLKEKYPICPKCITYVGYTMVNNWTHIIPEQEEIKRKKKKSNREAIKMALRDKTDRREHQIDSDEELKPKCSICYEDFVEKDLIIRLSCSHTYHNDCFIPWTVQSQTCPMCRLSIEFNYACLECKKTFCGNDLVARFSCRHLYHDNCIASMLKEEFPMCPTCNSNLGFTMVYNWAHLIPVVFLVAILFISLITLIACVFSMPPV